MATTPDKLIEFQDFDQWYRSQARQLVSRFGFEAAFDGHHIYLSYCLWTSHLGSALSQEIDPFQYQHRLHTVGYLCNSIAQVHRPNLTLSNSRNSIPGADAPENTQLLKDFTIPYVALYLCIDVYLETMHYYARVHGPANMSPLNRTRFATACREIARDPASAMTVIHGLE